MNERVKILWAKAAESNFGDSWEEQTAFMSKFAELIVRECIDTYDHWATHSMDKTAFVVARTHVKEHFGIEQ